MSNTALAQYGMDKRMFDKVCPGEMSADSAGFARIYIGGLQGYVHKLETMVKGNNKRVEMLQQQIKDKEEIIALLKK